VYEIRAFWEDAGVDHRTFAERSWKYKVVRFVESWACRKADHVAVLCSGLKKDLIQRGISPDKLTIISNGVDPDQFGSANVDQEYQQTWQLDGRTTIGFIGSFYRYEGLDLLVKAFSRVARVNPDVILLFVGGGETENELRNLVAQLSVEKQVIFGGRIAHNRIPGVYALMDVMVYPRYSVRLTELVTPLKPLEAMAMGKMIIASDIEGHREMIQHGKTGILFPPSEPEALAQALLTVINNPGMRGSIGSCASEWVRQNRSWEKTTEPYGSIYSRVMKR
jgi:PEP-CTERM/exosortase A-associated glycosyltransferase